MTRIILQPSGNKGGREHYRDTISSPVAFRDYEALFGAERIELDALFPHGTAAMWGVTPGKTKANYTKWDRAQPGDIVLFAASKRFFARGTIAHKFHNEALAEALWNRDESGQTWEYMYALDEVRPIGISYVDLNRVVGYADNNVVQGFQVLDESKSEAALAAFDLYSDQYFEPIDESAFREAQATYDGKTDEVYIAQRRKEQGFVRNRLFPHPTSTCDLCGESMPREFLIAAHIKKRSACSYEEKVDLPNVVMAACVFGCDSLYERGYVTVNAEWRIEVAQQVELGDLVSEYLTKLVGRDFPKHDDGRQAYFGWHRGNTFRGTVEL